MGKPMQINGVTTCWGLGEENYENYRVWKGHRMCQYDYRHTDGTLFTCCSPTLGECRRRRDAWVSAKGQAGAGN